MHRGTEGSCQFRWNLCPKIHQGGPTLAKTIPAGSNPLRQRERAALDSPPRLSRQGVPTRGRSAGMTRCRMETRPLFRLLLSVVLGSLFHSPLAAEVLRDVEYARVGGVPLLLDLYQPQVPCIGVVVYVHGGGWSGGSRTDCPISGLVTDGFAVASVDYRLSTQAPFPANIHDLKAAVRFLRSEAGRLGIPAGRIAIAGSSAGGHLAALAGVSSGVPALEGTVGKCREASSSVRAIVSFFGASNLQTILGQSSEYGLQMRVPALQRLLGGTPEEQPELARLASPVAHLDPKDPPLLLFHGDADPQMPVQQSAEFSSAYEAAGLAVKLHVLPGSKHVGAEFYDATRMALVRDFLKEALR